MPKAAQNIRIEQRMLTGSLLLPIKRRNNGVIRKPIEPPPAKSDLRVSDASKYRMATRRHVEAKLASTMPLKVFRKRSNF
tara:strand:- start:362 stop:601 length:240 start_codon:yes stop_codon:yes gene_type:complete